MGMWIGDRDHFISSSDISVVYILFELVHPFSIDLALIRLKRLISGLYFGKAHRWRHSHAYNR